MKRLKSSVIAACAILVAVASFVVPAPQASAQSSASLSIVPKKNYTVEPGESIQDTLTIRNLDSEKQLDLNLRIVDFSYNDDTGAPKLMLDENAPQTTWSLKPFMSVPKSVSIPPRGSKTVNVSVSIPANQGAGSYYSAIMYAAGSPDGGNVGLSASGVTLAFVSVPGEVNESLKLEKFGAYQPGSNARYLFMTADEPQVMAYTLKNEGNVTQAPVGSITLKHMFGQETIINDINPSRSLALIGQARTFTSCIKQKSAEVNFNGTRSEATQCTSPGLWPGLYTASLNIYYGQNGNRTQEIIGNAAFWYLPWWFVIALLIILAVLAYFVWKIVRAFRGRTRNNSHLRKRSRRRQ